MSPNGAKFARGARTSRDGGDSSFPGKGQRQGGFPEESRPPAPFPGRATRICRASKLAGRRRRPRSARLPSPSRFFLLALRVALLLLLPLHSFSASILFLLLLLLASLLFYHFSSFSSFSSSSITPPLSFLLLFPPITPSPSPPPLPHPAGDPPKPGSALSPAGAWSRVPKPRRPAGRPPGSPSLPKPWLCSAAAALLGDGGGEGDAWRGWRGCFPAAPTEAASGKTGVRGPAAA